MAWNPPEDDEVWTPPEGDVPMNEIVNDPRAAGLDVPAEIPAEVVPQSWLASLFPRTAQAEGAGATTAGAGLDVLSLPGRAYASLARPEGESYQEAIARTAPPAVMDQRDDRLGSEFSDRLSEMILRDPANIPLAGVTALTGGTAAPAWLARLGWAGRAARAGVPVGSTMAATRQAENVAAGRPVSAKEAGTDVAIGTGFGVASELAPTIGRGLMEGSKRGLQQIFKPGTAKQGLEIKEFRRALDAGLLPEMAGYGSSTAASAGQRFGERLAARAEAYPEILAAADATGQKINLSQAFREADANLSGQIASGRLPLTLDAANDAADWARKTFLIPDDPAAVGMLRAGWTPPTPRGPVAMGSRTVEVAPAQTVQGSAIPESVRRVVAPASDPMVLGSPIPSKVLDVISGVRRMPSTTTPARSMEVGDGLMRLAPDPVAPVQDVLVAPSVANARKVAAWKEAFKDPTKSTGKAEMAKRVGSGANDQLGQVSPELAALNAKMAPYYAAAPAMVRAAGARGNAYGFGPMELLGFGAGAGVGGSQEGLGGGLGGGLGAALLVRMARSPAAMRALYDVGRVGVASAPAARRAVPLAASAVDNARGGR